MEKDTAVSKTESGLTADYVAPGRHLLIDFWGCRNMQDEAGIASTLRRAATACGATVLDIRLHGFGEGAGVTGVAILAESHISIHTWPEIDYVALDVFVCGSCDAAKALPELEKFFQPERRQVAEHMRGACTDKKAKITA